MARARDNDVTRAGGPAKGVAGKAPAEPSADPNERTDPSSSSKRRARRAAEAPQRIPSTARYRPTPEDTNSILPRRLRTRAARERPNEGPAETRGFADPAPRRDTTPAGPTGSGKAESDPWTVPQAVRDRFTQDGHRFYFPDGAPAFRDHGRKLSTPSENTEVIHSLIEIAHARGWQHITVAGTERFRQEAWRQARLAGLSVRGYRASEPERAALIRALGRNAESARAPGAASPDSISVDVRGASGGEPSAVKEPTERPRAARLLTGKLLDHGREPYRFDPHEAMSYFVRLQTAEGPRTIWGQDLQRALEKSLTQPQIGDEIAMRRTGADAVTVKRRERDGAGHVLQERDLATRRHRWVLEKAEFFAQREAAAEMLRNPSIHPRQGVAQHPELAGTYLHLHAAEIAARTIRDPQDRQKFVALIRSALAASVAAGEPLQPVRLRERRAAERSADRASLERDPAPVRG